MSAKLHTDHEILESLLEVYLPGYPKNGDPWVPIDCKVVAAKLGIQPEMLFGRLYHDLRNRLEYRDPKNAGNISVSIFQIEVGGRPHCIHLPYVAATVAGMRSQRRRALTPMAISAIALLFAGLSAVVQLKKDSVNVINVQVPSPASSAPAR